MCERPWRLGSDSRFGARTGATVSEATQPGYHCRNGDTVAADRPTKRAAQMRATAAYLLFRGLTPSMKKQGKLIAKDEALHFRRNADNPAVWVSFLLVSADYGEPEA